MPGLRLAAAPDQTPYHAVGRIVEATHIRQGAMATFGFMAGLPSFTWDFKVVDVRTGEALIASHHRSIWAPASTWAAALEPSLRQMMGLPLATSWTIPPGCQQRVDGSWTWAMPGLHLDAGCLDIGTWSAETDTGGLWKAWTNGMGASLAAGEEKYLRARLVRSGLARRAEIEPTYLLTGQVFSSRKYLKVRYRALLTEPATGRVVARWEIRAPMKLPGAALAEVADQIVSHLETLQEPAAKALDVPVAEPLSEPGPGNQQRYSSAGSQAVKGESIPASQVAPASWVGQDRLLPARGSVDRTWVNPGLVLRGKTLHVADWSEPALGPKASTNDRHLASWISAQAPAWLYGALASHPDRGFRIQRQGGDLRLEGRVVRLDQPDRGDFLTALGGAFSFGLSLQAEGTLQVRLVDSQTGDTLALVEQELFSFQMASDGIPYKAFKWLAQDLVPWLLETGCRPQSTPTSPMAEPMRKTPEGRGDREPALLPH
ncbi:MAG TPA: hypothetical protein VJ486_10030 [Geothrix sp.]|nr:hypothetical protein [Geothrix sp.]